MAIRYGYPKGREDETASLADVLAQNLNVVGPMRHIFGKNVMTDALEVLMAQEVEHAAHYLTDCLAAHDAALIEQARAEGKAEADAAWVAKVSELADASKREGRGGTWVHDEWFRALIPADAATTLEQVRVQAKAEGLREAARDWANGPDRQRGVGADHWLHARADRIGGQS